MSEAFTWGSGGNKLTPADRRRRLAEVMLKTGADTSPVGHWAQGAARLAQALMGGLNMRQADEMDAEGRAKFDSALAGITGALTGAQTADTTIPAASMGGTPVASGAPATPQFGEIAPRLMSDLKRDFGVNDIQAAAVAGNLGHETAGFGTMQEVKPVIPGSRGGFGYAQWTGPRRVAFENFAKERGLDPTGYDANYGFLAHELANTGEGKVLAALRAAQDPQTATQIFSGQFLRPGIPGMASRQNWTNKALALAGGGQPAPSIETAAADLPAPAATPAQFAVPGQPAPAAGQPDRSRLAQALIGAMSSGYGTPQQMQVANALLGRILKDPAEEQLRKLQVQKLEGDLATAPLDREGKTLANEKVRRELLGEGATPLSADERASYGITATQPAYKTRSGEIKFGPAGTTVNVDTRAENAEAKGRGEGIAKRLNDLADDGNKAGEDSVLFQRFGDILNTVKTGKTTETLEKIRQATGLALDPNTDNVQALNALIQYMAPRLRVPGSGAQSDRELGNFLASIPSLAGTPEGNRKILDTMAGIVEHRRQRSGVAAEWQLGDISAKEAQKRIDALPSPFAKREAPLAAPDRAALEAEARRRGLLK